MDIEPIRYQTRLLLVRPLIMAVVSSMAAICSLLLVFIFGIFVLPLAVAAMTLAGHSAGTAMGVSSARITAPLSNLWLSALLWAVAALVGVVLYGTSTGDGGIDYGFGKLALAGLAALTTPVATGFLSVHLLAWRRRRLPPPQDSTQTDSSS